VSLDFEHNVRPAPVITEEVTASIEEMIQKRIIEVKYYPVLTLFGFYYNALCCLFTILHKGGNYIWMASSKISVQNWV
jgi:hypothetical protein